MRVLKQSTQVVVLMGPFLDKTDGVTEEAGLAGVGTEISKAGAAFGAGPVLGTLDSDGWYPITLTTTHTNTLGDLTIKVHDAATHLPVWAHFTVIPANAFDGMVSGTGVGMRSDVQGWLGTAPATPTTNGIPEVDVTHWVGGAVPAVTVTGVPEVDVTHWIGTAAATPTVGGVPEVDVTHWRGTAAAAPTVAGVPAVEVIDIAAAGQTDIRSAVGLATANLDTQLDALPTAAENADAVWDEDATAHQTGGTFGQAIGDPAADTNTIYGAVVTGAAGATVAADIIAIKAETASILTDTAEIGAAGAGLTAIDLPDQTMNITGNITGNLSGSVGSVTGAVGSVTGAVGSVTGLTASDVGAIKTKTDSLTFTVAGKVDSNITHVIADPVQASSAKTTNWGGT